MCDADFWCAWINNNLWPALWIPTHRDKIKCLNSLLLFSIYCTLTRNKWLRRKIPQYVWQGDKLNFKDKTIGEILRRCQVTLGASPSIYRLNFLFLPSSRSSLCCFCRPWIASRFFFLCRRPKMLSLFWKIKMQSVEIVSIKTEIYVLSAEKKKDRHTRTKVGRSFWFMSERLIRTF